MSGDALVWLCIPNGSVWLAFFQSERCRLYRGSNLFSDYIFVSCKYQYIEDMCLESCFDAYRSVTPPLRSAKDIKDVLSLW